MEFFVVLGASKYPIANRLFTKAEIEAMAQEPNAERYTFVPIEAPWESAAWSQVGGAGRAAYPPEMELTSMRVPKEIAIEVKKFSVWLAQQRRAEPPVE